MESKSNSDPTGDTEKVIQQKLPFNATFQVDSKNVGQLIAMVSGYATFLKNNHIKTNNENSNDIKISLPSGINITERDKNGDIQIIKGNASQLETVAKFVEFLNTQGESELHSLVMQENKLAFEIHVNSNKPLKIDNI